MKTIPRTYQTSDRAGNAVTFGFDHHGSWLEFLIGRDRIAIYGDSRGNRERMRHEILARGIKVSSNHRHLFAGPVGLAA